MWPGPDEGAVVGQEAQGAAGAQAAVLLVVDDCGAAQQELVDLGADGEDVPGDELSVVAERAVEVLGADLRVSLILFLAFLADTLLDLVLTFDLSI